MAQALIDLGSLGKLRQGEGWAGWGQGDTHPRPCPDLGHVAEALWPQYPVQENWSLTLGARVCAWGCLGPRWAASCQCPRSLCTAGPGRSREVQHFIPLTRGLAASSKRQGGLAGARASSPLRGAQPSPPVQHPQSAPTRISTVHLLSSWTGNIPCCFDSRSQPKIWGGGVILKVFPFRASARPLHGSLLIL